MPSCSATAELKVVDLGRGLSAAQVAKYFADLGATVYRPSNERPDPFEAIYPAIRCWRKKFVEVDASAITALLAEADVCILGGDDFPGIFSTFRAEDLARSCPRLVVVKIDGYDTPELADRPAVDLLVQARTGAAFEQFSDRPAPSGFPIASYGAALQAIVGAWVALVERERSGKGQVVTTSLAAGLQTFWAPFWMKAERPDPAFMGITPRNVRHLVMRCADGEFVQFTMGVAGAIEKVHRALKIPFSGDAPGRGMPNSDRGPERFFGDAPLFALHAEKMNSAEVLAALTEEGVPVSRVLDPGDAWDHPQTLFNGIIETDADGWCSVRSPIQIVPDEAIADERRADKYGEEGELTGDLPPLSGIRVLDCGLFVSSPYAAKLLCDYGAEVIRVEPPGGPATLSGERTIIAANFGKRTIAVDAKSPEGRQTLTELCATSDIVVHNFRIGVPERLGLDRATLRKLNPDIITLQTTAYGAAGPLAAAPGFDMVMQARSGLQRRAGGAGGNPLCSRTPLLDFATGVHGAIGLLVALFERSRTGHSSHVTTNLADVGLHVMGELVRAPNGTWHGAPLLAPDRSGFAGSEAIYRTADGWIAIAARSSAMRDALIGVLGLAPESALVGDDLDRVAVGAAMAKWNSAALLDALDAVGVWAEACLIDSWNDQTNSGLRTWRLDDPRYGQVEHCLGPLARLSRSPLSGEQRSLRNVEADASLRFPFAAAVE